MGIQPDKKQYGTRKEHFLRLLEKRALATLEVQRGEVICLESHSTVVGDPGFEPKSVGLKSLQHLTAKLYQEGE